MPPPPLFPIAGLQRDPTVLDAIGNGFRAAVDPQFPEYIAEMHLHCLGADGQLAGDQFIRVTMRGNPQHVQRIRRVFVQAVRAARLVLSPAFKARRVQRVGAPAA